MRVLDPNTPFTWRSVAKVGVGVKFIEEGFVCDGGIEKDK